MEQKKYQKPKISEKKIAPELNPDDLVIKKLNQYYDTILNLEQKLHQISNRTEELDAETTKKIINNLLPSGIILAALYHEIQQTKESKGTLDNEKVITLLSRFNLEKKTALAFFKTLKEQGQPINLEDLKNINIQTSTSKELNADDKKELLEIAQTNWATQPTLAAVEDLIKAFQNPNSEFHLVKYNKDILGFIRFDKLGPNELYVASLNVNPEAKGHKIGETILQTILAAKAEDNVIRAKCLPNLEISPRYIGEFGFVAIDIYKEKDGLMRFNMERNNRINNQYQYFNQPLEHIKKAFQDNEYNAQAGKPIIIKYNFNKEYEKIMSEAQTIMASNFVITGYKKDGEEIYIVFEKKIKPANTQDLQNQAA